MLFESVPGLYLVLTPALEIVAVSNEYLAATMTEREQILGCQLFEVFPDNPNDASATGVQNLKASLERVLASKHADTMPIQKYDVRRPLADGGEFEERYWSPTNAPVLGADGEVLYVIHRVVDVTELVWLSHRKSTEERRSAEFEVRVGNMERELYQRVQELELVNRELRALQSDLERRILGRTSELERANAQLKREIEQHKETASALRMSEEQLRHSQKMEAVGRLAGSVAHDFNNLLSVVLSYSVMLLRDLKPMDPIRGDIEAIKKAGDRAADLTRQLLAFSRQQVLAPKVVELAEIVSESQKMLERLLGEDIELVTRHDGSAAKVQVDPGQIDQVIMNLAINARDAMPRGGKLTIETRRVALDDSYAVEHFGVRPGRYVMLAVSDTGVGMDQQTQTRIFEPFFTTKPKGKGTGLGLSTVFGIVNQSGGQIWVYSEPDRGTTFKIYLPETNELQQLPREPINASRLEGNETILLVEDQADVREVAEQILKRYGYNVLLAQNAGEALLISERHASVIHLLLTDVVMPQMSGRELAERLLRMRADVRVLFMSGYTESAILHHGILDSGIAYLQKPLLPEALARRVREVLDTPAVKNFLPPDEG